MEMQLILLSLIGAGGGGSRCTGAGPVLRFSLRAPFANLCCIAEFRRKCPGSASCAGSSADPWGREAVEHWVGVGVAEIASRWRRDA